MNDSPSSQYIKKKKEEEEEELWVLSCFPHLFFLINLVLRADMTFCDEEIKNR